MNTQCQSLPFYSRFILLVSFSHSLIISQTCSFYRKLKVLETKNPTEGKINLAAVFTMYINIPHQKFQLIFLIFVYYRRIYTANQSLQTHVDKYKLVCVNDITAVG